MNFELKKKLMDEQPLTVEETLRLDQAIEAQNVVTGLMAGLEDQAPSLAWRSDLNQRLLLQSERHKRRSAFRWFSGFAAAAATVTAFTLFAIPRSVAPVIDDKPVVAKQSTPAKDGPSVEESILTAHREADLESGMGISFDGPSDSSPGSL